MCSRVCRWWRHGGEIRTGDGEECDGRGRQEGADAPGEVLEGSAGQPLRLHGLDLPPAVRRTTGAILKWLGCLLQGTRFRTCVLKSSMWLDFSNGFFNGVQSAKQKKNPKKPPKPKQIVDLLFFRTTQKQHVKHLTPSWLNTLIAMVTGKNTLIWKQKMTTWTKQKRYNASPKMTLDLESFGGMFAMHWLCGALDLFRQIGALLSPWPCVLFFHHRLLAKTCSSCSSSRSNHLTICCKF